MSGPKPQPMSSGPAPLPMTHAEPQPIPGSEPMGRVPAAHTHAIRLRFASGWDTYGTYGSREEAMEEANLLRERGEPASNIIVCRV